MKVLYAAIAVAIFAPSTSAAPAETCAQQNGCIEFSVTPWTLQPYCGSTCEYKICMKLTLDAPTCVKAGSSMSHTCPKEEGVVDRCFPTATFKGIQETAGILNHVQCQIVPAGTGAYFLLKDGATGGCASGGTAAQLFPFTSGLGGTAKCWPNDLKKTDQCTGNKLGTECIWEVMAPATCPTKTSLTGDLDPYKTVVSPPATPAPVVPATVATPPVTPAPVAPIAPPPAPATPAPVVATPVVPATPAPVAPTPVAPVPVAPTPVEPAAPVPVVPPTEPVTTPEEPAPPTDNVSIAAELVPEPEVPIEESAPVIVEQGASTSILDTSTGTVVAPPTTRAAPSGGGDPHFTTWGGNKYSYHGACDLVLIQAPSFANGKGLDVHIRTKHRHSFSYITNAAIRIGDEIFEVTDRKEDSYYLNGVVNVELPAHISGYKIHYKKDNAKMETYHIALDGRESLVIRVLKDFISVSIKHGDEKDFGDSLGLMGSFHTGAKLARDGVTVLDDITKFGEEWQVLYTEPKLFQTLSVPQHPETCTPPPTKTTKRRRLGEGVTEEEAQKLCEHVSEEDRDFCIFDIMATNDKDMVGAY
jgi:hypothetical protein